MSEFGNSGRVFPSLLENKERLPEKMACELEYQGCIAEVSSTWTYHRIFIFFAYWNMQRHVDAREQWVWGSANTSDLYL